MAPDEHPESCRQVLARLSDYLNLELPPGACADIENHLAACAPCEEFAASLRATVELCRRYRPSELPEPLGHQARAQLLEAYAKMLAARKTTP